MATFLRRRLLSADAQDFFAQVGGAGLGLAVAHGHAVGGAAHISLLDELAGVLRAEMPRRLDELSRLVLQRDPALAGRAHALAGSCSCLGARQLQNACLTLENAANTGSWHETQALFTELCAAWERLDEALRNRPRT